MKEQIESLQMQQRRIRLGEIPAPNAITEKFELLLMTHREAERVAGGEVNPAAQKIGRSSVGIDDDDCKLLHFEFRPSVCMPDFVTVCRKLEEKPLVCKANADGLLNW